MTFARTAVICGTARSCATHLPSVLSKIEKIGAVFDRHAVIIVENDSNDDTRARLLAWAGERPNTHIEIEDNLMPEALRTERIAYCRNRALAYARKHFADFGFLVWVDMDEPLKILRLREFRRALAYISANPDISGLFANSAPRYYDIWALRHPKWCPFDCWAQYTAFKERLSPEVAKAMFIDSRQIAINPRAAAIEVVSAFNGLGIYKMPDALLSDYSGTNQDGTRVCEHVPFNKKLIDRGKRLVIFPGLRVAAPSEHLAIEPQRSVSTPMCRALNWASTLGRIWTGKKPEPLSWQLEMPAMGIYAAADWPRGA